MANTETNLCFLTIREAGDLIRRGELSPVELIRAFLDRIEDMDDRLHSFITLLKDESLAAARTAEADILRGDYRGPLHGIPIGVKDIYDTGGIRTTSGSRVDIDRVPTEDATTVARLKAAGAIILGKLMTYEYALGGPDFTAPFPAARNPWNLDHITGGIQQRLRGGRGSRTVHGCNGFLHGRVNPRSRFPVRHRGPQGYLWPGESVRGSGP